MKIFEILRKIIKYLTAIILILFYFICTYTFILNKTSKEEYIDVFGYSYFKVVSGSMRNTIQVNDTIIVKITKDVKEEDIITFKRDDKKIITHRVKRIEKDNIITKGDANFSEDKPIKRNQVIGKVIFITRISSLFMFFSFLLILYIIFVLIDFNKVVRNNNDNKIDIEHKEEINI